MPHSTARHPHGGCHRTPPTVDAATRLPPGAHSRRQSAKLTRPTGGDFISRVRGCGAGRRSASAVNLSVRRRRVGSSMRGVLEKLQPTAIHLDNAQNEVAAPKPSAVRQRRTTHGHPVATSPGGLARRSGVHRGQTAVRVVAMQTSTATGAAIARRTSRSATILFVCAVGLVGWIVELSRASTRKSRRRTRTSSNS